MEKQKEREKKLFFRIIPIRLLFAQISLDGDQPIKPHFQTKF